MSDVTILYCTPNDDDDQFANYIRETIWANKGSLPVVSVSHKPTDFGRNICVGEVGMSYHNLLRQWQIGLHAIDTPYVLLVEDDTLYPPSYFDDVPRPDRVARYDNSWVMYRVFPQNRYHPRRGEAGPYYYKGHAHCAQVNNRVAWLEQIASAFIADDRHSAQWQLGRWYGGEAQLARAVDSVGWSGDPVVTIKTGHDLTSWTPVSSHVPAYDIPYWGPAGDLRKRMFGE